MFLFYSNLEILFYLIFNFSYNHIKKLKLLLIYFELCNSINPTNLINLNITRLIQV